MKQFIKDSIRTLLRRFDIGITRFSTLEKLLQNANAKPRLSIIEEFFQDTDAKPDLDLLVTLHNEHARLLLRYYKRTKAQLRQDLFVLSQLNFKEHGFFVELGATNGIDWSNTYLMEKELGWTGILAEPAKCWHKELWKNRSCKIDTHCVWKDSDSTLLFNEVDVAWLSTIHTYSDTDIHKEMRQHGKKYEVRTISLNDLLQKHNAPAEIDYLSIDTEGSEFEILNAFDFSKHRVKVITCEHNYTEMREKIFKLLTENGYSRIYVEFSGFDDWYVLSG